MQDDLNGRRQEGQDLAVVRLAADEAVTPALIHYLNRLSDHLFVLARALNDNGASDVLWVPGGNLGQ